VQLRLHQFDLQLRHRFAISREAIETQPTLIVELVDGEFHGFGEASANRFYNASVPEMMSALENVRTLIEGTSWDTPDQLWSVLADQKLHTFPLCAVDEAAHDLWGKRHGKPVHALWGLDPIKRPVSNYTIGIDAIDVMIAKMQQFKEWPVFKIKLGTGRDLEIIKALRSHTEADFRVDANCGWTSQQTLQLAPQLKELGVQFIEQPLPIEQLSEMAALLSECCLPILADENCQVPEDVDTCAGKFSGINIKLVKCGGLTPALRMIQRARELDLQVMVGCMIESSIGIGSIAQLLPLLDYVDMDGAALLADDIATGYEIVRGDCQLDDSPGCGVALKLAVSD
jgi:L-alanine-DL-glutamate epimerase-like enolase superfamily enzyme